MSAVLTADEIQARIQRAIPGSHVEITDLTGTQDHYEAVVVAAQFAGATRLEQHQLVYRALGAAVGREIHALALKTMTPEAFRGGVPDGETRGTK